MKEVERIFCTDVLVPDGHRALRDDVVDRLVSSISQIGLQNPIQVWADGDETVLIAGRHRLEAAKRLSWDFIDGFFVTGDEIDRRLIEISENLDRAELTVLERSKQISEWVQLSEQKLQLAQVATNESKRSDGRGHRKAEGKRAAARELGLDKDVVNRASKIASLPDKTKDTAKEMGLDNNQSALLEAAKHDTPEDQVASLKNRVSPPQSRPQDDYERSLKWRRSFETLWNKAPDPADREWAKDWIDTPIFDETRAASNATGRKFK